MKSTPAALLYSAIAALVLSASSTLVAETVKIPVGQQPAGQALEKPTLGMSMAMVEQKFGEPVERLPARGEPPISRWVYDQFVVYFESNIVIHSVVKHRPLAGS